MLSFKKHIKEAEAKAYGLDPKAGDEKRFKDKHVVAVTDYPGNSDDKDVQNMTKKSPAKKKRLADMDQDEAEKVYEEKMMKCEDCGEEYDADEGEHECDMEEHFERIAGELLDEGIDVDDLTEEQLDEILGRVVRGAARLAKRAVVNDKGNVRFSTAGRADSTERRAAKLEKKKEDRERLKRAQDRVAAARKALQNSYVPEEKKSDDKMTDDEMKKREEIVKGMKDKEADLKKRYGDRWKSVMYATATKKAMEEAAQIDELKKSTMGSYIDRAGHDAAARAYDAADSRDSKTAGKKIVKSLKRLRGVKLATDKLTGKAKVAAKEEVQIDEISKDLARSYKAKAELSDPKDMRQYKNRSKGIQRADKKIKEEFQIDEAFKVGSMKLKDGSSVTLAKEDVQALDNLYKNLNSSNRKKMQEKLEADKKSFGEILAFAKQAM